MTSLSSHQSELSWWVEINTSAPKRTYHFGPFKSREEAKLSRGIHVDALDQKEARDIVALIKMH